MNATSPHEDPHAPAAGHHHQYKLASYFEPAVEYISSFAGVIILVGFSLSVLNLAIVAVNAAFGLKIRLINPLGESLRGNVASISRIRLMLGEYTALALGVLVAADILDTVMQPAHSFEIAQVAKMGSVAALRTVLAYFLGKEIKELEESESELHAHHTSSREGAVVVVKKEKESGKDN